MAFPTKQEIIDFIKASPLPPTKSQIAHNFHVKGDHERILLKQILKELKYEGIFSVKSKEDRSKKDLVRGIFVVSVVGDKTIGRLVKIDGHKSYKLRGEAFPLAASNSITLGAGDRFYGELDEGLAFPLKLLPSERRELTGQVHFLDGNPYVLSTDRSPFGRTQPLDVQDHVVTEGDFIRFQMPVEAGMPAKLLNVIASKYDVSTFVVDTHGLRTEFPADAIRLAETAEVPPLDGREDLRMVPLVTIDGEDSKDFDDAVFAEPDPKYPGGYHLIVGIADVSYYVRPGTPLDEEAFARGTSVYFPDKVLPMLPERLSNGLCSLVPNEDRAALVAHMWIDKDGIMYKHKFSRALIKSHDRLTYNAVEKMMNDPDAPAHIKNLIQAYRCLKKARIQRTTLELEVPEVYINFDEDHRVKDITRRPRLESYQLIEEFMVLANVAAAETLQKAGKPCMYRIHENPSEDKIQSLRDVVRSLNIPYKGGLRKPSDFNRLLKMVEGKPYASLVHEMVLRTQSRAIYAPDNIGHYGLNLTHYAHFTSPIRRYADLLVHRSLLTTLNASEGALSSEDGRRFDEWGVHISEMEQKAVSAEREATDRLVTMYLKHKIGESFFGYVSGISRAGLFVSLEAYPVSGLLPMEELRDDYYVEEQNPQRLVGRRTHRTYQLGDRLKVFLMRAEQTRLTFASESAPRETRERSPRGRPGGDRGARPQRDGERRPHKPRAEGDRPPRSGDSDRRPYKPRPKGDRPPRSGDSDRRPYKPRPEGDRPSRSRDDRPRDDRPRGPRKP